MDFESLDCGVCVFGLALFGVILGCKILSLKHQTYGQLLTYLPLISYYFWVWSIWQPQLAPIPPGNNELEPIGAAPFQWATLSPSSTHSSRLATCLPHVGIFVCDSWLNDYELCDFIHFLVAAYVGVALGGHTVIQLSTRLGQIASFSRRDQAVLLTDPKDWWSWQCVEAASVRLCWTSCRTRCQIICKFVFCMGAERFGT